MMGCGIYCIKSTLNNKMYIGQTVDFDRRKQTHFKELKNNKHYNTHLQCYHNKYGINNLKFEILEECDKESLAECEQNWINKFPKSNLFNQVFDIQYRAGDNNPFYGKKHTEETKRKMSVARAGKFKGENNPNFGKVHSDKIKIEMSLSRSSKLDTDKVLRIVELLKEGESHHTIAKNFNINRTVVTRISNGTRWANITGGPVIPVIYEDGKRRLNDSHKNKIGKSHLGMKYKTNKEQVYT